MIAKRVFFKKRTIVTFLCTAILIVFYLGLTSSTVKNHSIPVFFDISAQCQTKSTTNENNLVIYVPSEVVAKQVSLKLCKDDVVAKQYGQVMVHWGYKLGDSVEFLGKGIADLILAKENIMQAFMAESTYNYQAVLGYSSYTAFFISLKEKPKLNKLYFLDKKIGLLDYPTSRSGHILPKALFKNLAINIAHLDVTYASSHEGLRALLSSGKVDLIASYWKADDEKNFSLNYITPMSDQISGSKWYLKMDLENTDLLCAVQKNLLELAQEQSASYFNQVKLYKSCPSNIILGEG
ncbi:hypothetical protein [Pseudoalteromonas denitrificans]|uniref:Uncharacterized protein n=1 Tax=Pseudoalteromonas denitrificans DSM 6059 TaxID=1123010 RepID=A0A1I1FQX4_9GAMM|nr:hypothetical protein [Pseudoalteromonas denitrificans]SFC00008.1 hypothetical protein SAMN02745724_00679 [Pseudoalteromonas denitrificans DSM 6059]